jgi:tRNA (guanine37-N1)-methyltransferase
MIQFEVLTLFPEMFESFIKISIIGKAVASGKVQVTIHNIRDYATDKHRTADDVPYGGGSGMVMKPEPLVRAIQAVATGIEGERVILLSPQGRPFQQQGAKDLASFKRLILVCGRYEGVDDRVREIAIDEEISIGDYVLTGGELAAMVIIDATARLVSGVLGDTYSPVEESFSEGLLEYPQYTRPREFMGRKVPHVLLSGDHRRIARWRRRKSIEQTFFKRQDLLNTAKLSEEERTWIQKLGENTRQLLDSVKAMEDGEEL